MMIPFKVKTFSFLLAEREVALAKRVLGEMDTGGDRFLSL